MEERGQLLHPHLSEPRDGQGGIGRLRVFRLFFRMIFALVLVSLRPTVQVAPEPGR